MNFKSIRTMAVMTGLLVQAAMGFQAYYIGTSLTDCLNYSKFDSLAKTPDPTFKWARDMIPGAPLSLHASDPGSGTTTDPYGHWNAALKDYSWSAVTMEPGHSNYASAESNGAATIINAALAKNPDIQPYIYESWPEKCNPWMPPVLCNGCSKILRQVRIM